MNTTKQSDNQSSTRELPPVLACLPWLDRPSAETVQPAAATDSQPAFDASFFQPHQLLATPEFSSECPSPTPNVVRFDPPQGPRGASPVHLPAAPAEPATAQTQTIAPATRTASRPEQKPTAEPITQLRFDPPAGGAPQPTEDTVLELAQEPSAWHQTIAAVDNTIRHYHRIIMLVALLTAAGLMMLVLESQQTDSPPASESVTPAAINTEVMEPLPLAEACSEPAAVPERVADAKGPQLVARRHAPEFELPHLEAPEPEVAVASEPVSPSPVAPQPEVLDEPEGDQVSETPDDHGRYEDTGLPEIEVTAAVPTGNTPPTVRLSSDLKSFSQQTR